MLHYFLAYTLCSLGGYVLGGFHVDRPRLPVVGKGNVTSHRWRNLVYPPPPNFGTGARGMRNKANES